MSWSWHGVLVLCCGVFGTLAVLGYGLSLAGLTKAQRAVRVPGRIERVGEPRNGGSQKDGIAVVVRFRDPSSGEEHVVTNDGQCGDRIIAAWVGREVGVRYPPRRPHAFRFVDDLQAGRRGLGWPAFWTVLVYCGLVALAAVDWSWPWALVGGGAPGTFLAAFHLPGDRQQAQARLDRLTAMAAVPGRVVAVLKTVETDADGDVTTSRTPVVTFTTHEGVAVTAHYPARLPDAAVTYGQDLVIHYTPEDPADFTPDLAAEHRGGRSDLGCGIGALVVMAGTAIAGGVLLWLWR
ncbi:DUF3592 domain-containing protein [Kitasatospora sp. NPDC091335]|uniref:DUF3592 domain-containing protein n=1 Tax=Kitasatospora sp. NPDC091335 TaxID=3364085 RepID=UPI0037F98C90